MTYLECIGPLAALLTTCSFMPQVYRTWKTRSTESLSWTMLCIAVAAAFLWLSYGVYVQDLIIIISNSIMGVLQMILLYFKFKFSAPTLKV